MAGFSQFVRIAWPAAVMMWMEWWSFEGLTVLVGLLPDAETLLGAHGTIFNVLVVFYMAFTGLNSAMSVMVGKHVGSGAAAIAAPRLVSIGLGLATSIAAVISVATYYLRGPIAELFESDYAVRAAIEKNILGAVLSVPGYAVLMTMYGACLGANRQRAAFMGTLIGYSSGLPLAWWLGCYLHWPSPLVGVWLGNVWALGFAACWVLALVLCFIPWAQVRMAAEAAETADSRLDSPLIYVQGASLDGDLAPPAAVAQPQPAADHHGARHAIND